MRPLEISRSGLLGSVAVLLVVAVCVRLGFWQLDRRHERLERNAVIAERLAAEPVVLDRIPADTAGLAYRRATARGVLDGARTVVLAGRSLAGSPGVHLLAPLRLGDGALLVNRGWMPARDAATVAADSVALEGEVAVEGVLLPFPETPARRTVEDRGGAFQRTWYRLSGDGIRGQYPYSVAPLYLLATARPVVDGREPAPAAGAGRTLPVILEPPSLDPGPHLSYAVQWFSFAAIFLVGWIALLVRRGGGDADRPGDGLRRRPGGPPGPPGPPG